MNNNNQQLLRSAAKEIEWLQIHDETISLSEVIKYLDDKYNKDLNEIDKMRFDLNSLSVGISVTIKIRYKLHTQIINLFFGDDYYLHNGLFVIMKYEKMAELIERIDEFNANVSTLLNGLRIDNE